MAERLSRDERQGRLTRAWYDARSGVDQESSAEPFKDTSSLIPEPSATITSRQGDTPITKYDVRIVFPKGGIPYGPGAESQPNSGFKFRF